MVMETTGLGKSSVTNRYRLYLGDTQTLCAEIEVVVVAIDMDSFRPVDLPDDVRAAFHKHSAS